MGCQAQLEGLERFVFAVAAGSLVCTYHKGSQEQAAGVRAGSEKGVAYHIATDRPRLISSVCSVRASGKEL